MIFICIVFIGLNHIGGDRGLDRILGGRRSRFPTGMTERKAKAKEGSSKGYAAAITPFDGFGRGVTGIASLFRVMNIIAAPKRMLPSAAT
jgi:hypothetical protein